jgi:tRNA(Ile)-lysidine synthase TilS/MesJ
MTSPHRLVEKVRAFAGDRTPSLACGRAVLAVSGGGDSIAMTSLLIEAGIVRPEASTAAWFDHRLRGDAASARDRVAVAALCAR